MKKTKIFMEEITRMIKKTPNDMELGKQIRDWYNTNKIFESPDGGKTIYERPIGGNITDRKLIKDGSTNEFKFKVGDKAYKPKGYKFPCTIVAVFETTNGDVRIVGEMDDNGMLHIFNESQLEHYSDENN